MANDQEETNIESVKDEAAGEEEEEEVKNAEETVDAADNANGESAEEPSAELLEKIKTQVEVSHTSSLRLSIISHLYLADASYRKAFHLQS